MIDDKQTVVTKPDATQSGVEGADAQDDLDQILSEYDEGNDDQPQVTKTEPAKTEAQPDKALASEVQTLRAELSDVQRERADEAVDKTVKLIAEQLPGETKVKPEVLRNYVEGLAVRNPKIAVAFMRRSVEPQAWQKIFRGMVNQVTQDFGTDIDQAATDDRESVASAVRSASIKAPADTETFDPGKVKSKTSQQLYEEYPDLGKLT